MRLRPLSLIFPDTSRATLWRWRKQGLLGEPDFVAHGREYYNEARFVKPLVSIRSSRWHSGDRRWRWRRT